MLSVACQKQKSFDLEKPVSLYYENKIEDAIQILNQIIQENEKCSECLVWLAQSHLRLGNKTEAEKYAQKVLQYDSCNSFAHLVYANAILPHFQESVISHSDSSWHHFMTSIECDSTNSNTWLKIWGESIRSDDRNRRGIK